MSSNLRLLGRSLTPRRLHSTTVNYVHNTPTTGVTTSTNQPSTLSKPLRTFSPVASRNLKSLSLAESQSSPSVAQCQIATMATMSATHGHSEACCNNPPVVSDGYVPRGTYEQLGGMRTYVTGPDDATKGLVSIFDIFGFVGQTLQGTDILGKSNKNQTHKVFMPDWFRGNPVPSEWYPPDTEEKQKKLGEWFGKNDPHGIADALPGYVKALQAANPSIKTWGLLGYCWGGKVVELVTASSSNPFTIAGVAHPAMIDPAAAEKILVPYAMLASGEDPADAVKEFDGKLKVPHHVEILGDQVHGWMAARADLADPRVRKEYARGYQTLLDFFGKHWQ